MAILNFREWLFRESKKPKKKKNSKILTFSPPYLWKFYGFPWVWGGVGRVGAIDTHTSSGSTEVSPGGNVGDSGWSGGDAGGSGGGDGGG